MWKAMLAGTTALTLLGGSVVYAQQTSPTQPGNNATQQRVQMTAQERVERTNARIAELKAELKLTAAQERNWPAFETAVRESAKLRAERFEEVRKMREQAGGQPRGSRGEPTAEDTANQKRLAAALEPLFKSLDEGQVQRFTTLFRVDGEGRHFWFRGRGEHRSQDRRS